MKLVVRPQAQADIDAQYTYYAIHEHNLSVAEKFLEAATKAIHQLVTMPHMGARFRLTEPTLKELRSWHIDGFQEIRLYYLVSKQKVKILRVLHSKRDVKNTLKK